MVRDLFDSFVRTFVPVIVGAVFARLAFMRAANLSIPDGWVV